MKLIRANKITENRIHSFLKYSPQIDKQSLISDGYIVEIGKEIIACFILEKFAEESYWLKQFYITKSEALKLPSLLESILILAREQQAKQVFVNSHKLMIDIILEALQFCPQTEHKLLDEKVNSEGKWWMYQIPNM